MMKKVTIHEMNGMRIIALDNEAFDWGVEDEASDIQKHFVDCFSDFLGRPTSLQEINKAIETGWIES